MDHHSKEQGKEPLLHAKHTHESHSDDEHDHHHHDAKHSAHHVGHDHAGGHGYDEDEVLEQKGLRLIPVFGDHKFSMFSMNYGLYLEFFHIIVRMLGRLFLLVIFFNLIDMATKQEIFNRVSYQADEVMSVCSKYEGKEDICAKELYVLSKCYRHSVRVVYAIVTSISVAIFMAIIRSRDEERVINNRMLYEFNWTQDLFSVLVDKVPKQTSADELRAYFNNLPAIKKVAGQVKDIVMVQDFGKCYLISQQIQKLTEQIEELHEKGKDAHELEGKVQFLKEELVREESKLPIHSGRAIVVFDSLKTKALVMKLYRPAFGASIERKFRKKKNDTALESAGMTVKDLPEPQDLLFENMCYPQSQKLKRLTAVYALGLLIILVGAAAGYWFEVRPEAEELREHAKHEIENLFDSPVENGVIKVKPMHEEHHHQSIFQKILSTIGVPVLLLVLEGVTESLFKKLNSFTRHKSHSEIEIACLNYAIFSSFFLYLFIQGAIMSFAWEEAGALVQTTIKIFCVKYAGKKLASAYFAYKNKQLRTENAHGHGHGHSPSHSPSRSASMADSHVEELDRRLSHAHSVIHGPSHGHGHGHKKKELHLSLLATAVKILFHVDIENEEFDFFEEASRAFPLIAMNFAFLANGKTSITLANLFPPGIPLTILAIYIGAFCDKYRLINAQEHCHLNSARFMLKMFRFLRGDHFAAIFGAGIWTLSFYLYISGYQHEVLQMEFAENNKAKFVTIFSNLNTSIITSILTIISIYVFYLIAWPKGESLENQFGKKFLDSKSGVSYDFVSPNFTATYQKPVLYHAEEHKLKQSLIL